MVPDETRLLLLRVIAQLFPKHQKQKDEALRALKYKMVSQGLGRSSIFDRAYAQIYIDSFEKYSEQVWNEAKRVLEETGFDAYPECEQDLIQLLNSAILVVRESDRKKLNDEKSFTTNAAEAVFEFHSTIAMDKVTTEVKILCAKLRTMKANKPQVSSQTNNYYLLGSNSRVNQGSTDNSVNIVSETDLFPKLRLAIESQISNPEAKDRILTLVNEGEKLPKRTDIYNNWFTKFLSLTADSMTVIQPFIPALAQLLVQTTN
jgi:hypothetical protein